VGEGGARVSYNIELQRPLHTRRGNNKLIVVVTDSQGKEAFRDRADINELRARTRIAQCIASITGDSPDDIAARLLDKLAQIPPSPPSNQSSPGSQVGPYPYELTPGGIVWNKETAEGIIQTPLTTFTAVITGQVVEDDGAETRRLLEMEATLRQRTHRFQVPAGQFAAMTWPMEHLGAGAALWPGSSIRDHARAAIQFLSGDPPERRVYAHLGWRQVCGVWCYLHASGAMGPVGPVPGIEVTLSLDLQRYCLPGPPVGVDLSGAVQASLHMLEVAGDRVTFPVYCAIWRTVLGRCDAGLHLVGHTGGGKTEVAALAQQHYGAGMDARHLPGSWLSTDNALEAQAFGAKDTLLVVDDFCPTGGQYDIQALHRKADRLFRGQGNAAGRGRLRADGTPRPTKPPRGMVLSTGEDVPRGQSLRARVLVVEVARDGAEAVDWQMLTQCQGEAAAGLYAQAMGAYLRWLAPRYQELRQELGQEIAILRGQAYQQGQHRRTPGIVADLAVGLQYFLTFAQEVGAVEPAQAAALWRRCWEALGEVASAQQEHQAASDPVARFLDLLGAVISSGRAHLSSGDGDAPKLATAWGWREVVVGTGDYTRDDLRPQGEHIGWLEGGEVYLQADAAYAVVQQLARDGGDALMVTLPTLKKRLKERGLLGSTEQRGGRERLEVRRHLQGKRRNVLHIKYVTPPESGPGGPSGPKPEPGYLSDTSNRPQNRATTNGAGGKVAHESGPMASPVVSEEGVGGPPGPLGPHFADIDKSAGIENTRYRRTTSTADALVDPIMEADIQDYGTTDDALEV
jgi:Domain of unknown function (DUF927)